MGRRNVYDFKCKACDNRYNDWADSDDVTNGVFPSCPACQSAENVKRVWTFGQFTFKGGLPSSAGRDPSKVWR